MRDIKYCLKIIADNKTVSPRNRQQNTLKQIQNFRELD